MSRKNRLAGEVARFDPPAVPRAERRRRARVVASAEYEIGVNVERDPWNELDLKLGRRPYRSDSDTRVGRAQVAGVGRSDGEGGGAMMSLNPTPAEIVLWGRRECPDDYAEAAVGEIAAVYAAELAARGLSPQSGRWVFDPQAAHRETLAREDAARPAHVSEELWWLAIRGRGTRKAS